MERGSVWLHRQPSNAVDTEGQLQLQRQPDTIYRRLQLFRLAAEYI